jgi:tetratricopeptide (TPR) repeat protein
MWVIKLQKAESQVALGQLNEAQETLSQCERDLAMLKPDEDLGLALHQLGNAFMRKGSLDNADQAFRLAVAVRCAVLKKMKNAEVSNYLAGTHKMLAVVKLLKLRLRPGNQLAQEAQREIDEALRIRQELLKTAGKEGKEFSLSLLHDLAMTLNTKGNVEGTVRNFAVAMSALNQALKIMRGLVSENKEWLPDLGICLADQVLFGVGARAEAGQSPPLAEAEECFSFYRGPLANQVLEDHEVRTKYFQFLGQAACPAAFFAGRLDRAQVFIDAGLDVIEKIREKDGSVKRIAIPAMYLFNIPPHALAEMVRTGFNERRFLSLRQEIVSFLS